MGRSQPRGRDLRGDRAPALQRLLDATRLAIAAQAPSGPAADVAASIFGALAHSAPIAGHTAASRVPACEHLTEALGAARAAPRVARVADAFAAIAPALAWARSANAGAADGRLADGYASAIVVGAGGLEPHDDVVVGASLMAPRLQYPDHRHPPAEIYLALSQGEWRQDDGPWHAPGPGGIVFNPPDAVHAMRSSAAPLLAIWLLWTREISACLRAAAR